jgi:hypothetical protein
LARSCRRFSSAMRRSISRSDRGRFVVAMGEGYAPRESAASARANERPRASARGGGTALPTWRCRDLAVAPWKANLGGKPWSVASSSTVKRRSSRAWISASGRRLARTGSVVSSCLFAVMVGAGRSIASSGLRGSAWAAS